MPEEKFLTGFCRQLDGTRMVALEYGEGPEGRELLEVGCAFETCVHRAACEVGKAIEALLSREEK